MKWFDHIIDALANKMVTTEQLDSYEKGVIGNSFDRLHIPKTSKYYEAYMIGFLHGGQSQRRDASGFIGIVIDRVIKRKKAAEVEVAQKAVSEIKL